ncbi:MAG: long-chain fatty acid--CoA ligase [Herpetosiphon sp.]
MYIGDWLGKRAVLTPQRLALVDDTTGFRYTYQQLNERANRLGWALRHRLGIVKGDRVAILARNRVEYLDALFATGKLGAILVPLNWRLTAPELRTMLCDCKPRIVIAAPEFLPALGQEHLFGVLVLGAAGHEPEAPWGGYDALLAEASPGAVTEDVDLEDPHLILYTSGTTGCSKGAILPHRVMAWNSLNTNISWELRSDDVGVLHTPLFHTGGINVLTLPILHAGGTMVLMGDWNAARCLELIEQERVTVFFAVPTMFQGLRDAPDFDRTDFSSVRFFISGGAACPVPLIRDFQRRGVPFRQGYGLTEASVNCFSLHPDDAVRKAGSVGRPIFHLDARVVNLAGSDVMAGETGELWLRGPTVFAGYWNNAAATAATLQHGWLRTGDLVRVDDEGYYFIVDRIKDMFISGGENVYPSEVEQVLHRHPAVLECSVVAMPDPQWGEVGWAAVVKEPGVELGAETLLEHCKTSLARYKLPKVIHFVAVLPRNAAGKVIKAELRESMRSSS